MQHYYFLRDHDKLRKQMNGMNSDKHYEKENAYLASQEFRFKCMEYENMMYDK